MKWQAITATTAARNVPIRYRITTRPMVLPPPSLPQARAAITRKNTSTGAIAFRALTNRVPRMPIPVTPGTARPRIAPTIKPQIIRFTKLMLFHLLRMFVMIMILLLNYKCSILRFVRLYELNIESIFASPFIGSNQILFHKAFYLSVLQPDRLLLFLSV